MFLELFQRSLNLCMSSRQYHFLIYLMNNHSPPNTFLNKHTYIILRDFNIIISHYLCMLHILNKSSILIRDIFSILYLYTNHCCLFDQIVMLVFQHNELSFHHHKSCPLIHKEYLFFIFIYSILLDKKKYMFVYFEMYNFLLQRKTYSYLSKGL